MNDKDVMKKVWISVAVIVALVVLAFFVLNSFIYREKQGDTSFQRSYKDVSYTVQGRSIQLVDGQSIIEDTEGYDKKIKTNYFGNEAEGDLDGDGISDIAFLLTQQTGGTGTFYFIVAALKTDNGYIGTNAFLLGDRIAPQTTQIKNKELIVNYADRDVNEPMTARPSINKSRYFKILDTKLIEITK